ncbi:MAG: reverse transcriptase family protein [Psychrobium sp.]
MRNKRISDEFFRSAVLKGNSTLFNTFSPSVIERKVKGDIYFEIQKGTEHFHLNERITKLVLSQIPINSSACGFVQNKSYFDFLKPHVKGYYFLRLDIKKFFHSIPADEVKELLKQYFSDQKNGMNCSALDLALKSVLFTASDKCFDEELREKEILPIGFSSSPVISNILFRRIDILIQKFCEDKGITYSRYADDMLFSSSKSNYLHSIYFEKEISIFVSLLSLRLKKRKRAQAENTISLNGYVIQNTKYRKRNLFSVHHGERVGTIRLSNKKTKIIKKLVASLNKKKSPSMIMENLFGLNEKKFKKAYSCKEDFYKKYSSDQLQNKIKGYRSYLVSLIKFNDQTNSVQKECLKAVTTLIFELEKHIE